MINGEMRDHNLLKEMHTFGKLADYQTESVTRSFEEEKKSGIVEHYAPCYRIVKNRIGIILKSPPEEQSDDNKKIARAKKNTPPDAILSVHELAALYLYNRLYEQNQIFHPPVCIICEYIRNFNRFIKDLKSGEIKAIDTNDEFKKTRYRKEETSLKLQVAKQELQKQLDSYKLKVSDLPDACLEYLLSYKKDNRKFLLESTFKKMWKDTVDRLKETERKRDCPSFNGRKQNGKLAQELARDIVFFTPPRKEVSSSGEGVSYKKINNLEFDVLQKMLAYFPFYKDKLKSHLGMLKDTDNKWKHPFLFKCLKDKFESCSSISDFYVSYYEHKKKWIESIIEIDRQKKGKLRSNQNSEGLIKQYDYFLKLSKIKPATEKMYSEKAIFLPTGLFDKHIAIAMKEQGCNVKETDNITYFLKTYFKGKTQNYYSLPRYYTVPSFFTDKGWDKNEERCAKEENKGSLE
jgi:hypothetical protein